MAAARTSGRRRSAAPRSGCRCRRSPAAAWCAPCRSGNWCAPPRDPTAGAVAPAATSTPASERSTGAASQITRSRPMWRALGTPNEPAAHHQHVAFDVRPGQQIERGVDDHDVPPHAPRDPQRAAIQRQPPGERAAGRKAHVALHAGGAAVVVEAQQLRHHARAAAPAHHGRVAGRLVGIDDDDAVLRPGQRGQSEHQEETADEESHAELGKG